VPSQQTKHLTFELNLPGPGDDMTWLAWGCAGWEGGSRMTDGGEDLEGQNSAASNEESVKRNEG
jgi:hypothetical protein